MTISFTRYIDISSAVAAANVVTVRNYGERLFTDNDLLPPQSFIEFSSSSQVGAYFGTSSTEYLRSVPYFAWISKNNTKPTLLSFARWVDTAVAPMIFGNIQPQLLATYTAITTGSFQMTIGGVTNTFTGLDFSAATSLTNVASIIQTAINGASGTMWTAATVTYDASRGSFNFVGGSAITATISVAVAGSGVDIASLIGWLTGTTLIIANGSAVETITTTLTDSFSASNNFGSFDFIPSLTLDQVTEAAVWTNGLDVEVMYLPQVSSANASSWNAALSGYSGVGLTLSSPPSTPVQYPQQLPAQIFAATNYLGTNSVQNYMFQTDPSLTASVTTDTAANTYDALRINYYGNTQTAGQTISFYQRGLLFGTTEFPVDMNTFANEIWLKDANGAALMTLLLTQAKVSANAQGVSQITATLQAVINQAIVNGVISVGKVLTQAQITFITTVTNDVNAWQQVQNSGYWLNVQIVPYTNPITNETEYKAVYTLIYSKDDDVRKVEGQQTLI